ncbi:MAG: helix-turn-helix domain-containing protein, partial [Devosia sp.]
IDAGETILAEHGEASVVGNVIAGVMRMTKTLPDGRQQIVGLVYPGEFFGRPYSETTEFAHEAATDIEICVIDRHAFESVLARHPELEHALLLTTLSELAFARERLLLLGCQNTLERVASYLLVMLERRRQLLSGAALESHKLVAVSAISRRDLAGYLGTTIETISRHVHYLSRRGVIRIINASHFEVLDRDELLALSGLAQDDLKLFGAVRVVAMPFGRPVLTIINGAARSEDRVF